VREAGNPSRQLPSGLQFGLQFTPVPAQFTGVRKPGLTCGMNACEPL
jgi:hypothetical protein